MDSLLTPQEAAYRLGTSLRFVRRLIFERRGLPPIPRRVGYLAPAGEARVPEDSRV